MWTLSCVLDGTQISDASILTGRRLTVAAEPIAPPRRLLAHVLITEDARLADSYAALTVVALRPEDGAIDLQPLLALSDGEQQALRSWLIARRWPAWARAALPVRAMLGEPDPPVLLAEAARQWMLPLATLTSAAAQERLPTIVAGDRQLVYRATIAEARERRLLRDGRGRPGRG